MGRKPHKQRHDTVHGAKLAAEQPDLTAVAVPKPEGYTKLNATGRRAFEALFRADPGKWTVADHALILSAASIAQQVVEAEAELQKSEFLLTHPNGTQGLNPLHTHYLNLLKTRAIMLRDLGLRSKDGASASATVPAKTRGKTPTVKAARGGAFDAFEGDLLQ